LLSAFSNGHLEEFDIDDVQVNSTGPGDVIDGGGAFPDGQVIWRVLRRL
jgi:hypothetical protein